MNGGPYFFNVGLAFARDRFRPRQVFLHVAAFNERARLVYERAGFRIVSSHVRTFEDFGEVAFLTMTEAEQVTVRRRQGQPEQPERQRPEPQERPRPTREV